MGTTVTGLLVRDGDCIRVSVDSGATGTLIWPQGYRARRDGSDLEVLDPAGRVVARTGTVINSAIGGWVSVAPHPNACTEQQRNLFEINQQLIPRSQ